MNLLVFDHASRFEYDAWETLGNDGWNWDSIFESMQRASNFTQSPPPFDYTGEAVAKGGPVQYAINDNILEHQKTFLPAMKKLGVPNNLESLDGDPLGAMFQPSSVHRQGVHYTRSYSVSYLATAGRNLQVVTNATVAKINIQAGRATGVTLQNGTVITAKKEVILSAGTMKSPGVLELSGIGNKTILQKAGITPVIDLPGVGENLQDHLRIQNNYELKPNTIGADILRFNTTYASEQRALYNAGKRSLYDATANGFAFLNWNQMFGAETDRKLVALAKKVVGASRSPIDAVKLDYLTKAQSRSVPQAEIILSDGYLGVRGYPAPTNGSQGRVFVTLIAGVQHPFSKGSVHINTTNPTGAPLIDPKYLGNEYDLEATKLSAQYLRKLANTAPLNGSWTAEFEPGPSVVTDADWASYVRNSTWTIYHPAGTCAMLPKEDGGVVDSTLKVYGVSNLRVVDASIMPILISAHIQTAVYGIAERAADFIVDEWSYRKS